MYLRLQEAPNDEIH